MDCIVVSDSDEENDELDDFALINAVEKLEK
jgi:hypothetical protein